MRVPRVERPRNCPWDQEPRAMRESGEIRAARLRPHPGRRRILACLSGEPESESLKSGERGTSIRDAIRDATGRRFHGSCLGPPSSTARPPESERRGSSQLPNASLCDELPVPRSRQAPVSATADCHALPRPAAQGESRLLAPGRAQGASSNRDPEPPCKPWRRSLISWTVTPQQQLGRRTFL